ncbi:MAG: CPBP family intramembrane metalloprotease [Gemmatimonadetes bacterium]|nr:CPBP family intramembrane metalloprotease [Gemmatimonadota bacterium]
MSIRERIAAVSWSLAFVILGYLLTTVGYLAAVWALPADRSLVETSLLQAGAGLLVFGALSWLVGRRALGLSNRELGWAPPGAGLPGFGKGLGLGLAVGALALGLGWPLESRWQADGGGFGPYLGRVLLLALFFTPAALFEELAFRGVLLSGLTRGLGRLGGLLVTSGLFAVAHRANPSVTPLALGNIALAGVFLGLTFLTRGGLWSATGAHLGWNVVLAALAAPVSGLPFEVPWIDFVPGEPAWMTGGSFGPEGGLLASVALGVGVVSAMRWSKREESA